MKIIPLLLAFSLGLSSPTSLFTFDIPNPSIELSSPYAIVIPYLAELKISDFEILKTSLVKNQGVEILTSGYLRLNGDSSPDDRKLNIELAKLVLKRKLGYDLKVCFFNPKSEAVSKDLREALEQSCSAFVFGVEESKPEFPDEIATWEESKVALLDLRGEGKKLKIFNFSSLEILRATTPSQIKFKKTSQVHFKNSEIDETSQEANKGSESTAEGYETINSEDIVSLSEVLAAEGGPFSDEAIASKASTSQKSIRWVSIRKVIRNHLRSLLVLCQNFSFDRTKKAIIDDGTDDNSDLYEPPLLKQLEYLEPVKAYRAAWEEKERKRLNRDMSAYIYYSKNLDFLRKSSSIEVLQSGVDSSKCLSPTSAHIFLPSNIKKDRFEALGQFKELIKEVLSEDSPLFFMVLFLSLSTSEDENPFGPLTLAIDEELSKIFRSKAQLIISDTKISESNLSSFLNGKSLVIFNPLDELAPATFLQLPTSSANSLVEVKYSEGGFAKTVKLERVCNSISCDVYLYPNINRNSVAQFIFEQSSKPLELDAKPFETKENFGVFEVRVFQESLVIELPPTNGQRFNMITFYDHEGRMIEKFTSYQIVKSRFSEFIKIVSPDMELKFLPIKSTETFQLIATLLSPSKRIFLDVKTHEDEPAHSITNLYHSLGELRVFGTSHLESKVSAMKGLVIELQPNWKNDLFFANDKEIPAELLRSIERPPLVIDLESNDRLAFGHKVFGRAKKDCENLIDEDCEVITRLTSFTSRRDF